MNTQTTRKRKNPAAVALGRLGGLVGGRVKSAAKTAAARANGKLGGRPPNKKKRADSGRTLRAAVKARGRVLKRLKRDLETLAYVRSLAAKL